MPCPRRHRIFKSFTSLHFPGSARRRLAMTLHPFRPHLAVRPLALKLVVFINMGILTSADGGCPTGAFHPR